MFTALGHTSSACRLHQRVTKMLETLELGPDGKSEQRLGRACVCWGCGHVGLPRNTCSETGPKPAAVCTACGEDDQTNFVKLVREGKHVPWIEATPKSAEQAAKAEDAAKAAEAVETS